MVILPSGVKIPLVSFAVEEAITDAPPLISTLPKCVYNAHLPVEPVSTLLPSLITIPASPRRPSPFPFAVTVLFLILMLPKAKIPQSVLEMAVMVAPPLISISPWLDIMACESLFSISRLPFPVILKLNISLLTLI